MIRIAKKDDVDFIYELSQNNLETAFEKSTLCHYIETEETTHLFIIEDRELIGFIIVWESDSYGQIYDLVIKESKRRLGYATKAIEYAISFLKEKNVKTLSLEVSEHNKTAIKLYEKLGFKNVLKIENYYKDGDGFLYLKDI